MHSPPALYAIGLKARRILQLFPAATYSTHRAAWAAFSSDGLDLKRPKASLRQRGVQLNSLAFFA
jgi:hypothetical protein